VIIGAGAAWEVTVAEASTGGAGGLDAEQWRAVFGLVLEELRASATEDRQDPEPGAADPDAVTEAEQPPDTSLTVEDHR
jgi:hypothetical protein